MTLVRDRVMFLELKTERGKLSDAQKEWLGALLDAGAEAYVARPSDLEDLAAVLGHMSNFDAIDRLVDKTAAAIGRPVAGLASTP